MYPIIYIAIALVAGLALSRVVKLVHLPNVTGYLVAGLLVGPILGFILGEKHGLVTESELHGLKILTNLALGFIAFSIGGEFKLSAVKKIGGKVVTITFVQALAAMLFVLAGLFIAQSLGADIPTPAIFLLAAIATATAPAATLMVVKQYKAKGPVTDALLPVVAFDDAIGLMLFSICFAVAQALDGGVLTVETALLEPLREIFLSVLVGAILGVILSLMMKFFKSRANRLCLMLTAVLLGVGLSDVLHLSSLLTCMMVGALFANMRGDSVQILDGAERWTPPLFMLFFVLSGVELDLTVIPTVGVIGVVYLICRSLGKYFGARWGGTITKADKNVKKYLGITLLPQAGVAIGMAQLVVSNVWHTPGISSIVLTVVLTATFVYELVGPVLTKIALQRAGEVQKENGGLLSKFRKKDPPTPTPQV
ncbi:MAG: cation:proton antiporter [Clostridia bacterium]|nr:cation:proton antiporter [Clostridia bacterium]